MSDISDFSCSSSIKRLQVNRAEYWIGLPHLNKHFHIITYIGNTYKEKASAEGSSDPYVGPRPFR